MCASVVHCCIYLGSGADPTDKHSSPSRWAMETPACHSYFATHLDALCISSHRAYLQNYTWFIYGREYENISTSQMGKHKESEGYGHP